MENRPETPENNKNVEGYKVPGDGNAPNRMPEPGNKSFEENPHHVTHLSEDDIPGKEFNIGDKAYSQSSKSDFIETVSKHNHASPDDGIHVDLHYKTPDGDR